MKVFSRGLFLFLLGLPLLGLLSRFHFRLDIDIREFLWALENTALQAFFSCLLSLFFGFWGALGLLQLSQSRYQLLLKPVELFLMAPSFLPTLLVILSLLQMFDPFPMGLLGVVLVHSFMNFGFVAVLFFQMLSSSHRNLSEVCYILGVGTKKYFTRVLWPLHKKEIFQIAFLIFSLCFTSFAVPLVVGGGRGTTLEVLVYEKIRLGLNWNGALTLSFIQMGIIFILSQIKNKFDDYHQVYKMTDRSYQIIPQWGGLVVATLLTVWMLISFVTGCLEGVTRFSEIWEIKDTLAGSFLWTCSLGLSVGLLTVLTYLLVCYNWPDQLFKKALEGFLGPTTVLTGFGLILFFNWVKFDVSFLKIIFGEWLIFFPILLRWGGWSKLDQLTPQIELAEIMGASSDLIFRKVTFPQVISKALELGAIASFWSTSEFALLEILSSKTTFLAQHVHSLVSSYRLGLGSLLSLFMILSGLVCFLIIKNLRSLKLLR